nr:hypothetical protein BaRGS_027536 [Batillaria attramentaria]
MDKKHFLPLGFGHLPPLPPPQPLQQPYDDDDFEEDIDEDDISDFEEELQQELLACRSRQQQQPDMTKQLLAFADMVNTDIQKFFGRKKGDEDSCDVYEDKWVVTKSGRELYYADLLRIAQGDFGDSKSSSSKNTDKASSSSSVRDRQVVEDNRNTFSGKADLSLGLGPLKDLFEVGLRQFLQDNKQRSTANQQNPSKRLKPGSETDHLDSVPMHQRRFPDSFWREPGMSGSGGDLRTGTGGQDTSAAQSGGGALLGAAKLPDFSDLMESWHGDQHPHHHHPHHQQQQQLHQLHHHGHSHHRTSASETITSGSGPESTTLRRL